MTLLADLPWLRLAPPGESTPPEPPGGSGPRWCTIALEPAALARVAAEVPDGPVVLVLADILPDPTAASLSPDPALLALERPLLWPAVNDITGEIVASRGLWLLPTALLLKHAAAIVGGHDARDVLTPFVVPEVAATWLCGSTPECAFQAGFGSVNGGTAGLSASLGADHAQGAWWGIGACRGLLGGDASAAWAEEQAADPDGPTRWRRWNELARRVRVERGVAVHPMGAEAAAALRRMRGTAVPKPIWDQAVADLGDPATARLREACALAAATLWGDAVAGT